MSKSLVLALSTAAAVLAAAPAANAATTLTLGPSSLCAASGCFADNARVFTQSFSLKNGAFDVSQLRLFKGLVGDLQDYAVKISFTTADGTVVSSWGSYVLATLAGDYATINGQQFSWNGADGDLVLKLEVLMPSKSVGLGGGFAGFAANPYQAASPFTAAAISAAAPRINLAGPAAPDRDSLAAVAVPEPASWALMITGFGLAGAAVRRRRGAQDVTTTGCG
ncbi:PEPxxWA-CTERM sorting domain-containing protein [Phenylobacterium sp.]|uniref:PEPxxWA-CTERM sorting domain-containing protein n=1 Tax=Phenylobacterium sp. TaxID=1871053 RepID=UPI0025D6A220|nr:PEPxxWA-CTERM sorting domain-containing protein [Phenylobacterium sp.]